MTHQPFPAIRVADVPFRATSLEEAAQWLVDRVAGQADRPVAVRLANAYCVALASRSGEYGRLLATSGVNFPDGAPVVAVMRAFGRQRVRARRVRGPSFFREVLGRGVDHGVRHFFLGTTPATLASLENAASASYPGIRIAGSYSPPFAPVDEEYLHDLVERAKGWDADVVWVGMGTPKQDFIAQALADRAGITAVGVGAGFDFVAGSVREAPQWMQHAGLEWVYRLATEPRRLWQRYVFGNGRFVVVVLKQIVLGAVSRRRRRTTVSFGDHRHRVES